MNIMLSDKQGLALMKRQLKDMSENPQKYMQAFQSGYVYAGFGGNLNGIEVPNTLMSGKLPPGVTPQQAFEQVVEFMKKTITDYDLNNKRVIIRVDFNVPIKDGIIQDDTRIRASLKTIKYAISHNAKVILLSHLGKIKEISDLEKNDLLFKILINLFLS